MVLIDGLSEGEWDEDEEEQDIPLQSSTTDSLTSVSLRSLESDAIGA
jgi:hypothetical protein